MGAKLSQSGSNSCGEGQYKNPPSPNLKASSSLSLSLSIVFIVLAFVTNLIMKSDKQTENAFPPAGHPYAFYPNMRHQQMYRVACAPTSNICNSNRKIKLQPTKTQPVIPPPPSFIEEMETLKNFLIAQHKYILDTGWHFRVPMIIPPTMQQENYQTPDELPDKSGVLLSSRIFDLTYEMEDLTEDMVKLEEQWMGFPSAVREGFKHRYKQMEEFYDDMRHSWETLENAGPEDFDLQEGYGGTDDDDSETLDSDSDPGEGCGETDSDDDSETLDPGSDHDSTYESASREQPRVTTNQR